MPPPVPRRFCCAGAFFGDMRIAASVLVLAILLLCRPLGALTHAVLVIAAARVSSEGAAAARNRPFDILCLVGFPSKFLLFFQLGESSGPTFAGPVLCKLPTIIYLTIAFASGAFLVGALLYDLLPLLDFLHLFLSWWGRGHFFWQPCDCSRLRSS